MRVYFSLSIIHFSVLLRLRFPNFTGDLGWGEKLAEGIAVNLPDGEEQGGDDRADDDADGAEERPRPPNVLSMIMRSGISVSLLTRTGRRKLSASPTTMAHQSKSAIAGITLPMANR